MIRLGDTVDVKYGEFISKMWLVKDLGLKKYTKDCYVVLGFERGKGWWTLNNGTLKAMRAFVNRYRVEV